MSVSVDDINNYMVRPTRRAGGPWLLNAPTRGQRVCMCVCVYVYVWGGGGDAPPTSETGRMLQEAASRGGRIGPRPHQHPLPLPPPVGPPQLEQALYESLSVGGRQPPGGPAPQRPAHLGGGGGGGGGGCSATTLWRHAYRVACGCPQPRAGPANASTPTRPTRPSPALTPPSALAPSAAARTSSSARPGAAWGAGGARPCPPRCCARRGMPPWLEGGPPRRTSRRTSRPRTPRSVGRRPGPTRRRPSHRSSRCSSSSRPPCRPETAWGAGRAGKMPAMQMRAAAPVARVGGVGGAPSLCPRRAPRAGALRAAVGLQGLQSAHHHSRSGGAMAAMQGRHRLPRLGRPRCPCSPGPPARARETP
jgi:hypothetical protein